MIKASLGLELSRLGVFEVTIYSLVQSFCEFFPISSSGHLAVVHQFLSIDDPGVEFDLFLHLASLMAILIYFREKIKSLSLSLLKIIQLRKVSNPSEKFALGLILSTISSVIFILLIKDISKEYGRNNTSIALCLIIFGILLFLADYLSSRKRSAASMNNYELVLVGLAQAFAVFPGVSRSGATITIMRSFGVSKVDSAEFSFLLAIPIILMGSVYKFLPILTDSSSYHLTQLPMSTYALGFFITFISSYAFISLFLKFLKQISFSWFMIYRIILGLFLLF